MRCQWNCNFILICNKGLLYKLQIAIKLPENKICDFGQSSVALFFVTLWLWKKTTHWRHGEKVKVHWVWRAMSLDCFGKKPQNQAPVSSSSERSATSSDQIKWIAKISVRSYGSLAARHTLLRTSSAHNFLRLDELCLFCAQDIFGALFAVCWTTK